MPPALVEQHDRILVRRRELQRKVVVQNAQARELDLHRLFVGIGVAKLGRWMTDLGVRTNHGAQNSRSATSRGRATTRGGPFNPLRTKSVHASMSMKCVTTQIVAMLEWINVGNGNALPINALTKKPYRGVNTLALWATAQTAGYTTNEWGTYRRRSEHAQR